MKKTVPIATALSILLMPLAAAADSGSTSGLFPVRTGTYAPDGECNAAAAAVIYVEQGRLGANKASGRVKLVKRVGEDFVLDLLWLEAGGGEEDGVADTVTVRVKDRESFLFTNPTTEQTLMTWCN